MVSIDIVMNQKSSFDVIMQRGYSKADIIITGLDRYYEFSSADMRPLAIALKTTSDIVPYIILLDHSADNKDAIIAQLKSCCDDLKTALTIQAQPEQISLITSLDKCVLHIHTDASENVSHLKCEAAVIACICISINESLSIQTDINCDINCEPRLHPILKSQLLSSELDIRSSISINDVCEFHSSLLSSAEVRVPILVVEFDEYYMHKDLDEYLLTDMDNYTVPELLENNI